MVPYMEKAVEDCLGDFKAPAWCHRYVSGEGAWEWQESVQIQCTYEFHPGRSSGSAGSGNGSRNSDGSSGKSGRSGKCFFRPSSERIQLQAYTNGLNAAHEYAR